MRVGLLAGEKSADNLGAELMRDFRQIAGTVDYCGHGGDAMKAEGLESVEVDPGAFGILEVIAKIPRLLRARRLLVDYFVERKIDVLIGIDMPDFAIGVEERLHQRGIKTVHFVSPTIWAWRPGRAQRFLRANDRILCIYPFECELYQDKKAVFVGHPLAQALPMEYPEHQARARLDLHQWIGKRWLISILPGSRHSEIERLLHPFVSAVELCHHKSQTEICCLVSAADQERKTQIQKLLDEIDYSFDVQIIQGHSNDVIAAANQVLVASGTASLQTMLIKRPMIIAYKVNPVTAWLFRRLAADSFFGCVGMPNILANEQMVPEFVQEEVKPESIAQACLKQMELDPSALISRFNEIHSSLRSDYSAARALADLMEISS